MRRLAVVLVAGLIAGGSGSAARADVGQPLVGGDYYNTECTWLSQLLRDPTSAMLEREQMFAMHASGLNSLALGVSFTSDPSLIFGGHGGAISIQPDGTLGEPYRSRLIAYLTNARDAGFTDVTIRFYPYGQNSPFPWTTGVYLDDWDPALYAADWRLIQDVHDLAKQYGPPQSHFDLIAEGAPSDYYPGAIIQRLDAYIARLYTDYVTKYGNADVFFSVIDKSPSDDSILVHLIIDLESTGKPLPLWWGLDIEYTGDMASINLAHADATLRAFGVGGSLALEETAYESADVAAAVQSFNATAAHPVVQVEEYPNLGTPYCVSAPFTGDAYLKVLGIEPGPLRGQVDSSGRPTLTTSDGVPVTALRRGSYTIIVTDASTKAGFRLATLWYRRQTSAAFRGTVTWTVDVGRGDPNGWTYASVGKKTRSVRFTVLGS